MNAHDREKGKRWVAGELIPELAFRYNTLVEVSLPEGGKKEGWIVSASLEAGEPVYTVETRDGSGDYECPESAVRAASQEKPNQPPDPTAPIGRGLS